MLKRGLSTAYWKKVYRFLGPQTTLLLWAGGCAGIVLFAVELGFAYSLQAFLVKIGAMNPEVATLPSWVPTSTLVATLIFLVILGVLRGLLQWAQSFMAGASAESLKYYQRSKLLHWAFHSQSASASEIIALFTERTHTAGAAITNIQTLTVQVVSLSFLGLSLFYFAPGLTFMIALALFLLALVLRLANKRIRFAAEGLIHEWDDTNRRLLVSIKNLLLMQIYGTQDQEEEQAQKSLTAYFRHAMSSQWIAGMKAGIPQILGILLICGITLGSTVAQKMPPGRLLSYFYLFVRFMQTYASINLATANLLQYWPQLRVLAAWWANCSVDNLQINSPVKEFASKAVTFPFPVGWKVSDLDFQFHDAHHLLFSDLNLLIEPGKVFVITGASGVGKSTLIGLLLGNLIPGRGSVEIITPDGATQKLEAGRARLLESVGYVGAESFLIEGTIRANVAYGLRAKVTDDEMAKALRQAECHFVFDLPLGLDHPLTEQGQGLSAGQKQRLSLARSLLRKPRVLLLDEATANLDSDTEQRLVETFQSLRTQMTIVAVTHRKALLQIADQHIKLGSN